MQEGGSHLGVVTEAHQQQGHLILGFLREIDNTALQRGDLDGHESLRDLAQRQKDGVPNFSAQEEKKRKKKKERSDKKTSGRETSSLASNFFWFFCNTSAST